MTHTHYVTWYEVLTKGCLIVLVAALFAYLTLELIEAYRELRSRR